MANKTNKKEDNRLLLGSVRMPDVSNPSRDEVFKRRSAVSDDWEPSKELLDAIKSYEKFSPVVYKDGNGVETIGYGITDKKIIAKYRGGKRMSKREAERLFNRHVDDVIAQMKDSIPNFSAMSNNQKDAMTSYVYNVGIGGVTRKSPKLMEALENKNWKEAAKQMDFGYNDKNNSGLRRRRDEERALFTAYLDMGLEEPTEEELAAAHARMQQNALEDILSSRNELELQDPLRTKFDEAYRVAVERKQPTFTWNGREFATDLKQNGGPASNEEEQAIIDRVNQSKADFIQRLLNGNPMSIPDWEKKGNISTHKLRAEIDENGNAIVFPIVQNIDGKLYDFSDPANGRSMDNEDYVWRAMDSAISRGDTVRFDNIGEAIWFADNNYKKFYDSFQKPDGGPVAQRDAIQPPANPTMDFMNLIGESIPYDAGTLPDINVIMDLSPEEYRDAMRKAAARRGRNYVYQAQEEAAPLIQGLAGAAAAASLVSVGLFQPTMNFAADFMSMLENPLDPVNYLPYSDVSKIARRMADLKGASGLNRTRYNVNDEYSEKAKKFFKDVLVPEYDRIIERSKNDLSDNGKKLLESRMKGLNEVEFINEADRLGINYGELSNIERTARMQINSDLIKKEIEKPDAFKYNVKELPGNVGGEYRGDNNEVYISEVIDYLGGDTKFSSLIHEFRHKMDSRGIERGTVNEMLKRFILSRDEVETLESAYESIGKTKNADELAEKIATNSQLKTRVIKRAKESKNNGRPLLFDEVFDKYDVTEDEFRKMVEDTSDDDLINMLHTTNGYGADYASHINEIKDPESRKEAIDAVRKAVSTIPFSVYSAYQGLKLMNDKPIREEDIVQGGDPIDIEMINNVVYNNLKDEMRDGGSFSDYLSKVDGDNLIDKLSKTNYYGKKRANLFKLARMGNKEAYNVLIDDFKEKLLEIDRKQNKNNSYEEGGEIDEELSPNEAILRRIANDLSSRNMLAENAAYYSGQDEITAEELANYIGKMSPHRFVMSIGSDDDELNDFSTRLTTGVLDGDEQAMEDVETLRRMMLETPFNNSNITIMKDGGNMLPDVNDMYMTLELLKYEQGGEAVKDRQMYVYKRLKEEAHMDDLQALAVIGNLMGESGLNPYLYGDQDTSYGIQQWRGERRDRLNKLAREKGEETPSFETQVDYLINEYLAKPGKNGFIYDDKGKMGSGYYNYSLRDFQNASTLRDATVAWNLGSGRPHKNYMRNDERYRFAKQAANNLGIELDEPDTNYYSDNGIVQNGFSAPSVSLAQNDTPKEAKEPESSMVKIEEGNIPDRSTSKPSEGMTEFQQNVINELLVQRGLIMGEQARQQEESEAQRVAEERQARINEEARRNAIIQSVLQNAKLDIPGMASS